MVNENIESNCKYLIRQKIFDEFKFDLVLYFEHIFVLKWDRSVHNLMYRNIQSKIKDLA